MKVRRGVGKGDDGGFVLILVLWVTALLALLAVGFASSVRSSVRAVSSAVQGAKAEAIADAGIELAVLSLLAGGGTRRFAIDATPASCSVDGLGIVTLRVQDTGGRISINLASERMLQAMFMGLGADREAASRASDVILDYRDPDSNRRPNGAEKPEYIEGGRTLGPKNGPFDTVDELGQVMGLDPALLAQAMPHLTVHSQIAGLDPRAVTGELAQIVSRGADLLPARAAGGKGLASGPLPGEFVTTSPQRVFWISSAARLENGAAFVRESVVELQSTRSATPVFKVWRRGSAAAGVGGVEPAVPAGDVPRC